MNSFTLEDYREYLINRLIPSIFKLLPLYEEENKFLRERIDSLLNFELFGLSETIGDLPKTGWYGETVNTLRGIEKQLRDNVEFRNPKVKANKDRFRREIFKMTALIDRQVNELDRIQEKQDKVKEG